MPGNKEMTWKKNATLKGWVSDIRIWLEAVPPSRTVDALLRNSNNGPDGPVHWAHHHPQSKRYPLNVVTLTAMEELVNGIARILRGEFKDKEGIVLGHRWRKLENCQTEWKATDCFKWDENVLASVLNGTLKFVVPPAAQN